MSMLQCSQTHMYSIKGLGPYGMVGMPPEPSNSGGGMPALDLQSGLWRWWWGWENDMPL